MKIFCPAEPLYKPTVPALQETTATKQRGPPTRVDDMVLALQDVLYDVGESIKTGLVSESIRLSFEFFLRGSLLVTEDIDGALHVSSTAEQIEAPVELAAKE